MDLRARELAPRRPSKREDEERQQLARPAFARVGDLDVGYLAHGDLARNREHMARFGAGLKAIEAVVRRLYEPRGSAQRWGTPSIAPCVLPATGRAKPPERSATTTPAPSASSVSTVTATIWVRSTVTARISIGEGTAAVFPVAGADGIVMPAMAPCPECAIVAEPGFAPGSAATAWALLQESTGAKILSDDRRQLV